MRKALYAKWNSLPNIPLSDFFLSDFFKRFINSVSDMLMLKGKRKYTNLLIYSNIFART